MQPEIHLGPLTLQTFGIMFALGFIAAGALVAKRLRELGKPVDWAYELIFAGLIGGIVGSRLDFIIENWSDVHDDLLGNIFSGSGLVWYGGAIGGTIGVLLWARWRRMLNLTLLDICAPGGDDCPVRAQRRRSSAPVRQAPQRKEHIMAQSDAEILRSAYDAFAGGDVPAVLAVFAEDIEFRIPGDSLVSGTYTGHDEVVGFFQQLGELSDGTFTVTAQEILDNGTGTVVALCELAGERNGRNPTFDTVQVWRVADGKATSFREFNDDQSGLDAFWS